MRGYLKTLAIWMVAISWSGQAMAENDVDLPDSVRNIEIPQVTPGPDLTLKEALDRAEKRNATLAVLRAELERADANLATSWALVAPVASMGLQYVRADHADEVDLGSSMTSSLAPIFEQLAANGLTIELPETESEPVVIRQRDDVSGSMTVALPLVNLKNWFSISAARKGLDLVELTTANARQQILVGVAQAYYVARMSLGLVKVNEAQVLSAAHHLDFAKKRFSAGTGLRIDVVRAETDLVSARQLLINAHLSLDTARDALGVLTGIGGLPLPSEMPKLPPATDDESDMVTMALDRRLDIRLGKANLDLARRDYRSGWAAFLPTADMAWAGSYHFTDMSDFASQDRSRWNLIFNVNVPIFQWANIGTLWSKKTAIKIAELQISESKLAASQEVRQFRRDYLAAKSTEEIARTQVDLAREGFDLAMTAYRTGVGSSLEVTDARQTVSLAEINMLTSGLKTQIALIGLYRALGHDIQPLLSRAEH